MDYRGNSLFFPVFLCIVYIEYKLKRAIGLDEFSDMEEQFETE